MLFRVFSYLRFIFRSGNAHALHSPFVYDLYTECITGDDKPIDTGAIEGLRKSFLNSHKEIEVTDFGAGSKSLNSKKRKLSDIARVSVSNPKKCRLLLRLSGYFRPESILELGTNLGISTAYLHKGFPEARLIGIEGDETLYNLASSHLDSGVELINETFDSGLNKLKAENFKAGLIYIDGDHRGSSVRKYVEHLKSMSDEDSVFILDDIYWSKDMNRAWKKLIADPYFGISIDLFDFGLLFPRKKQPKQHFRLRF